jgi:hypothetical protein
MIVGMDWLEQFSPMMVHWVQKWMLIPYNGQWVQLQGELPADFEETLLELTVIIEEPETEEISPPIQALIDKYESVFTPPQGLPPSRPCDHAIPLIAGATPFVIRPYRYSPTLKTEIEAQIAKMLEEGIIRPSSSPFSSSVVMTKKKDGSWRFCVDYRFLNALTIKSKYPFPIIDEFLDELSKASWFTKLDLRSGFHQILLKAGEEYKTAFSTHSGQYEFLVMPFGVTGGPGTFQSAMNTTLKPLLRICVLVFLDDILIYSSSFQDHLEHIEVVLNLLDKDGWKVKPSKCTFAKRSIAYLGHVISSQGVATDPSEFIIYTDQKSLSQLSTQRLHTARQQKAFTKLLGFQYKVIYKEGVDNTAADALSRHPAPPSLVMAISTAIPQWIALIVETYNTDPRAQELLQQLAVTSAPVGNYTLQQGLIRYKGKIWVGSCVAFQKQLFQALHESAIGGHSGFLVTYAIIKQLFFGQT